MTTLKFSRAAVLAAAAPKSRPCSVQMAAAKLTPAERKEFQRALNDFAIPLPSIQRVMAQLGHELNRTALHHHRHGRCGRCYGRPR